MRKNYYIYAYVRLDTNTYFYIGKGCGKRKYEMQGRCQHFANIIKKYDTVVEIILDNLTEEEAYYEEQNIIEDLVFNEGYSIAIKGIAKNKEAHLVNKCWGGGGPSSYTQSEYAKECLRKRMTGRIVKTETRQKLSFLNTGTKHPQYGTKQSEETKKKISEANKGKPRTKKWIKNLSESHKGQISHNRKRVYCVELDLYFDSATEAILTMKEKYNVNCCKLGDVCNGNRKTAGRYNGKRLHWEWAQHTPATTEYRNFTKVEKQQSGLQI